MHHVKGRPAGGSPRFKVLDSLTRRVLPVVVSTGLILGNVSVGLAAQEVVQLRESADICRDCISFETVAVLGGDYDGDNLLTGSVHVNRGSVLLVSASIRTPELAGIPFHLVHLRGTILDSFGPEASLMPGAEGGGRRHIIVLDEGRFLSTSASGRPYRIELWNGRSIQRVWTREAEWFPRRPTRGNDGNISPHVSGISGDGSRLWTIVSVPDPSWTPSPPGTRVSQSGEVLDNRFDTVVEVIDLNANEIVATQRFDQYVFGLLSGETVLRLTADDLGVPLWLIRSLKIHAVHGPGC